jgi:hypothetical protein
MCKYEEEWIQSQKKIQEENCLFILRVLASWVFLMLLTNLIQRYLRRIRHLYYCLYREKLTCFCLHFRCIVEIQKILRCMNISNRANKQIVFYHVVSSRIGKLCVVHHQCFRKRCYRSRFSGTYLFTYFMATFWRKKY